MELDEMMSSFVLVLVVVACYLFANAIRLVIRFNRAMPQLWRRLEASGRGERARVLNDKWSNLAAARYLYDGEDCEDPSISTVKAKLARLHRSAILHFVAFMMSVTLLAAAVLAGG